MQDQVWPIGSSEHCVLFPTLTSPSSLEIVYELILAYVNYIVYSSVLQDGLLGSVSCYHFSSISQKLAC